MCYLWTLWKKTQKQWVLLSLSPWAPGSSPSHPLPSYDITQRTCHVCVTWRTHLCIASFPSSTSPTLHFIILKRKKIFVMFYGAQLHPFPQSRIQFLRVNKPTLSIRASYCWGHGKPRWGQGKNCHKMFLCFEQTHTKLAYASKPNLSQKKNTVLVIKVWGICSPNHITKGLWSPTT